MLLSMQLRNVAECRRGIRTEVWLRRHYEGDWQFSPEWWGTQGGGWGRGAGDTVFESQSAMGNGFISVTSHPASTPVCCACPTFPYLDLKNIPLVIITLNGKGSVVFNSRSIGIIPNFGFVLNAEIWIFFMLRTVLCMSQN